MNRIAASARGFWRGSGFLLPAALLLVASADVLFYRHVVGWTAGLFTAIAAILLLLRPAAPYTRWPRRIVALGVLGLIIALIEEPTILAIVMTFIALCVLAMTSRDGWSGSVAVWLRRWGNFLALGWTRIFRDGSLGARWLARHPDASATGALAPLRAIAMWVIPLLLGGVFVALFAAANPIVERWTSHGMDLLRIAMERLPDLLDPVRVGFWLIVLVWAWSLLRVRTPRHGRRAALDAPHAESPVAHIVLPPSRRGFIVRCLVVFNAVFAVETVLDVVYLWGGRALPGGMTFKEYAHRGSYPLVLTALLAAAFVLLAFRKDSQDRRWRTARALVYTWIAQNVLLTFSSGWRLWLLVDDSNLTRLRLATWIWLGLVGAGLISIVCRILSNRDNAWLLRANVLMTAAVLYVCCFLNLDGFIAGYNAGHCLEVAQKGSPLGLTYLRDLGPEALPALTRLSHSLDTPDRRAMARDFAEGLHRQVADELTDWHGWTWRRARIKAQAEADADGLSVGRAYVKSPSKTREDVYHRASEM